MMERDVFDTLRQSVEKDMCLHHAELQYVGKRMAVGNKRTGAPSQFLTRLDPDKPDIEYIRKMLIEWEERYIYAAKKAAGQCDE